MTLVKLFALVKIISLAIIKIILLVAALFSARH